MCKDPARFTWQLLNWIVLAAEMLFLLFSQPCCTLFSLSFFEYDLSLCLSSLHLSTLLKVMSFLFFSKFLWNNYLAKREENNEDVGGSHGELPAQLERSCSVVPGASLCQTASSPASRLLSPSLSVISHCVCHCHLCTTSYQSRLFYFSNFR